MRVNDIKRYIFTFLLGFGFACVAYGDNKDGATDLGVDYAFMFIMALSPDFAAANYTVENEDGSEVDIRIGRLPYHVDLFEDSASQLQLEIALAYQRTTENISTFPVDGESIDAEWDTYGVDFGLLYEHKQSDNFRITPSLRFGLARMDSFARYNGPLTNSIKNQLEGTLFNWETNAAILNLGLGFSYSWELLDRASTLKANAYHVIVDSYNESNDTVKFTEPANMLTITSDMIFPTHLNIEEERLDLVLLLGVNNFFGENRRTLGYTTSYQAGIGGELPLVWRQHKYGYLRLSGQLLWADNMDGWLITLGYSSK
ncbi:Solitary outer membrane autotransporter beta-barrel domain [Kaarinaea lacus]